MQNEFQEILVNTERRGIEVGNSHCVEVDFGLPRPATAHPDLTRCFIYHHIPKGDWNSEAQANAGISHAIEQTRSTSYYVRRRTHSRNTSAISTAVPGCRVTRSSSRQEPPRTQNGETTKRLASSPVAALESQTYRLMLPSESAEYRMGSLACTSRRFRGRSRLQAALPRSQGLRWHRELHLMVGCVRCEMVCDG